MLHLHQNAGYSVEDKNSHKLMEAIKDLIDNEEERERRGKLGRKLAEENYDIRDYHKKIIEVYEKAYKRQKNKLAIKQDETIDYSIPAVKELSKTLNYIYSEMFPEDPKTYEFSKEDIDFNCDYKIDYSLESVRNLINKFNKDVYLAVREIKGNFVEVEELSKFKKFVYLYVNDRPELIYRIGKHLSKHKISYKVFRSIYRALRGIKRLFFRDKYGELEKRVQYLEAELYTLKRVKNKDKK